MKRFGSLFAVLLGIVAAVAFAADPKDQTDILALTASNVPKLHRVTDAPFKMDDAAAAL